MHSEKKKSATRNLFCTDDAQRLARRRMPRMMFDFVCGGAGCETSQRLNLSELEKIRLQPRVLVNVEGRTLGKRFLGEDMRLPFGIAPMGMCNLTWPGADRMLAAAAVERQIPVGVSTAASTTLEDMAECSKGRAWFQLYVGQSNEAALEMTARAKAAGYKTLMLTVDVPQISRRLRDHRNGFQVPFQLGVKQFTDFALHPRWSISSLLAGPPSPANFSGGGPRRGFVRNEGRGKVDWAFLQDLRDAWDGNLIVKGVTFPQDAARIKKTGADAVYVSNHGGRQLDSAPPAIATLAPIRAAVGPDYPLIFDSGIRTGEDVVKALATGADFVMLGRPMLYAIGADGLRGLSTLIDNIAEEVDTTLAQIGVRDIADVGRHCLYDPAATAGSKKE